MPHVKEICQIFVLKLAFQYFDGHVSSYFWSSGLCTECSMHVDVCVLSGGFDPYMKIEGKPEAKVSEGKLFGKSYELCEFLYGRY